MKSFGVYLTFPDCLNAEAEIINRLVKAASNVNIKCIPIDDELYIYSFNNTSGYVRTSQKAKKQDLDFILSTHFKSPKSTDIFTYGTLWNPPSFLGGWGPWAFDNLFSYDRFLSSGSRFAENHVKTHSSSPNSVSEALLYPSSHRKFNDPSIGTELFYCGINWDKLIPGKGGRYAEMLKLLEQTCPIKIYGPEEFGGIIPWEGFTSYQKSLPFDGDSLIDEIHKCGICLVASSQEHTISEIMSNRLWEAMSAGADVIASDHSAVRELLGDLAFYFDPCASFEDQTRTIKSHMTYLNAENIENQQSRRRQILELFNNKICFEVSLQNIYQKDSIFFDTLHSSYSQPSLSNSPVIQNIFESNPPKPQHCVVMLLPDGEVTPQLQNHCIKNVLSQIRKAKLFQTYDVVVLASDKCSASLKNSVPDKYMHCFKRPAEYLDLILGFLSDYSHFTFLQPYESLSSNDMTFTSELDPSVTYLRSGLIYDNSLNLDVVDVGQSFSPSINVPLESFPSNFSGFMCLSAILLGECLKLTDVTLTLGCIPKLIIAYCSLHNQHLEKFPFKRLPQLSYSYYAAIANHSVPISPISIEDQGKYISCLYSSKQSR